MPIFSYSAKSADQKIVKGQLAAASEQVLIEQLRQRGLSLMSSSIPGATGNKLVKFFANLQGVPVVQKIFFTQNLGVMLRGGFSIGRAMGTLALQTNHKYFKRILLTLQSDLESGMGFSPALKKYPRIFPDIFTNMVAAGEISGKLDEVLKTLTVQMKKDHQLVSKVKGAMTYPIVVIIAMIGAGVTMITFVIPKLLVVFTEANVALPLPTRILIAMSHQLTTYGLWYVLGLIALITAIISIGRTVKGKFFFDQSALRTPILGPIVAKINLARFTRNLSSMMATDIPIIQAFQIIASTLSNSLYRQAIDQAGQALRNGTAIAKVLEKYPRLFPPIIQQMISVGEESGTLDEVSGELANFLEEEIDQTMSNLSTIIEPVLLLVLGVAVAGMAVAILLPMYNLSSAIN